LTTGSASTLSPSSPRPSWPGLARRSPCARSSAEAAFERVAAIVRSPAVCPPGTAPQRLIVERFIPGPEVAVEGLLRGGQLEILAVFDKPDPLDGLTRRGVSSAVDRKDCDEAGSTGPCRRSSWRPMSTAFPCARSTTSWPPWASMPGSARARYRVSAPSSTWSWRPAATARWVTRSSRTCPRRDRAPRGAARAESGRTSPCGASGCAV
jgi:hypothetical protein